MYDPNKAQHPMTVKEEENYLQSELREVPGLGLLTYYLYERDGSDRADFGTACEKTYDIRICLQPESRCFAAFDPREEGRPIDRGTEPTACYVENRTTNEGCMTQAGTACGDENCMAQAGTACAYESCIARSEIPCGGADGDAPEGFCADRTGGAAENDRLVDVTTEVCDLPDIARSRAEALHLFGQLVCGMVTPCAAEETMAELL